MTMGVLTKSNRAGVPVGGVSRRAFVGAAACAGAVALPSVLGLSGCAASGATDEAEPSSYVARAVKHEDVSVLLEAMTRREKICQMLMPDFRMWNTDGTAEDATDFVEMNDQVDAIVDKYGFGGVILFANNVHETQQTFELTYALQTAAVRNSAGSAAGGIPLLLGIDQEGGIVYRLGSGCAMPGNMALGAARSADLARQCGQVMADELGSLGINVDFAPVMDVNNNPNNPVIGLRSFSDRPELVSELGCAVLEGIQGQGVCGCAKHFPGHGDAATDSHTGLPRIDKSLAELEELEFVPFRAAFEAGVDMVMTAHIQYPQVETETATSTDPDMGEMTLPATLSKTFLTDILRDELGFTGVAITDALNMDAISANFTAVDAVRRTFLAGADIALMPVQVWCSDDVSKLEELVSALEADEDITDERLDASVRRILELKLRRGILALATAGEDVAGAGVSHDEGLETALATVGCEANREVEREAAACAVTVVHGDGLLPFKPQAGQRVVLVAAQEGEQPGMELAMRRLIAEGVVPESVEYDSMCYAVEDEGGSAAEAAAAKVAEAVAGADFAVVVSEIGKGNLAINAAPFLAGTVCSRAIEAAGQAGVPLAIMSVSKPYDLALYDEGCALVAVYGNKGMDPTEALAPDHAFGPNVPAGVEAIFGGHEVTGKLPVDIYAATTGPDGASTIDTSTVIYPYGTGETL